VLKATAMLGRANYVLERADTLDGAVSNLQAYRSLLEEQNARSLVALPRQQVQAVEMVRAAILRSTISLVVATLDRGDRRGNRASLGEIVRQLEDEPFAEFLLTTLRRGRGAKPDSEKLRDPRDRYHEIIDGQTFKRVQDLRHNAIAHLLVSEQPPATVECADIFALAYEIERQVIALYEGLGIRPPQFASFKEDTAERAKLFWQTYFAGVAALA
jgi:hypothetical protein